MLPYVDGAALFGLVPFADAVAAVAKALSGGLDPQASMQRSIHDVEHGQLLVMPAETANGFGVKLSTVTPGNPGRGSPRVQALYVLYDRVTLTPVALLDGTALTTLRTPAVSAVAADHLAAPEARRLVVFGSGPQAWGHVEALRTIRPLADVTVVGRDRSRAEALVTRVATSGLPALRVLAVARTLLLLSLPVVADLLEGVLERGECGAVRPLTLAVLLGRRIVRLAPGLLRLARRATQGGRHFLLGWHGNSSRTCTWLLAQPRIGTVCPARAGGSQQRAAA